MKSSRRGARVTESLEEFLGQSDTTSLSSISDPSDRAPSYLGSFDSPRKSSASSSSKKPSSSPAKRKASSASPASRKAEKRTSEPIIEVEEDVDSEELGQKVEANKAKLEELRRRREERSAGKRGGKKESPKKKLWWDDDESSGHGGDKAAADGKGKGSSAGSGKLGTASWLKPKTELAYSSTNFDKPSSAKDTAQISEPTPIPARLPSDTTKTPKPLVWNADTDSMSSSLSLSKTSDYAIDLNRASMPLKPPPGPVSDASQSFDLETEKAKLLKDLGISDISTFARPPGPPADDDDFDFSYKESSQHSEEVVGEVGKYKEVEVKKTNFGILDDDLSDLSSFTASNKLNVKAMEATSIPVETAADQNDKSFAVDGAAAEQPSLVIEDSSVEYTFDFDEEIDSRKLASDDTSKDSAASSESNPVKDSDEIEEIKTPVSSLSPPQPSSASPNRAKSDQQTSVDASMDLSSTSILTKPLNVSTPAVDSIEASLSAALPSLTPTGEGNSVNLSIMSPSRRTQIAEASKTEKLEVQSTSPERNNDVEKKVGIGASEVKPAAYDTSTYSQDLPDGLSISTIDPSELDGVSAMSIQLSPTEENEEREDEEDAGTPKVDGNADKNEKPADVVPDVGAHNELSEASIKDPAITSTDSFAISSLTTMTANKVDFNGASYMTFEDFMSSHEPATETQPEPQTSRTEDARSKSPSKNPRPSSPTKQSRAKSPLKQPSSHIPRSKTPSIKPNLNVPSKVAAAWADSKKTESSSKASAKLAALKRANEKLAKAAPKRPVSPSKSIGGSNSRASSPVRKTVTELNKSPARSSPTRRTAWSSTPAPPNSDSAPQQQQPTDGGPLSITSLDRPYMSTSALVPKASAEVDDLLRTVSSLRQEVADVKARLVVSEKDRVALREEVQFLEKLVEQEASAANTSKATAGGAENNKLSEASKILSGDLVSKEELEKVRREIQEQETLIKGYQNENEKLTEQTKLQRKQLKEVEARYSARIETLQREITTLKTQLSQSTNTSVKSAAAAAHADQLEAELAAHVRDLNEREASLQGEINKLRAQLSEAQLRIDSFKGCEPHEVAETKQAWAQERQKFEAYIVELESKLEREIAMRESERESRVRLEVQQRMGEALRSESPTKESVGKSPGKKKTAKVGGKLSVTGVPYTDSKRVKELEKLVVDLQERLIRATKGPRSTLSEIISSTKPNMDENTYIRHLKERIQKLENEINFVEASWQDKLQNLQSESNKFKAQYEARVEELQRQLEKTHADAAASASKENQEQSEANAQRIKDLEQQLESLLKSYHAKLSEAENATIGDHVRAAELSASQSFRTRESAWRQRVQELEIIVDSQAASLEQLRTERALLEQSYVSRLAAKDDLVRSYEEKIENVRKEFHDRIFGMEEQKLLEEIHRLKLEVEELRGMNADLKNRLEISESTRKAVSETTVTILKQAQEESAKIALAHHERALTIIRDETKAQTTAAHDSEMKRLQLKIADSEKEIQQLRIQITALENQKDAMSSQTVEELTHQLQLADERITELEEGIGASTQTISLLEAQLAKATTSWPPDRKRFEDLAVSLTEMEIRSRRRESELQELVRDAKKSGDMEVAKLKAYYEPLLLKKERLIRHFRGEMDQLLGSLELLKQHGGVSVGIGGMVGGMR
ncbi:hypothetical protein HDV05_006939 [Chytridiales sp. JEL 0842]|nr:hypothetical protein HDV05_006939 [Chytridiales sp. JEL 0842]